MQNNGMMIIVVKLELIIFFTSALTLLVGQQEGQPACKN